MQLLQQEIREKEAALVELQKKIDAMANDPFYATHPQVWEADRNEYFDLLEEVQALYERKLLLMEERRNDPAYDGSSPSLTKKEERAFFRSFAIRTKEDILEAVGNIREHYRTGGGSVQMPLEKLLPLLDRFSEEIAGLRLMNLTQDWWQYEITVRETDITLSLASTMICYDRGRNWEEKNRPFLIPEASYPLVSTRARLLSPEEFGALYGVPAGTVRQWIRRGKLRSASKFGKEWRIPELTVVRSGEHYVNGDYAWKTELPDVPEEFACLKDYRACSISSVRGVNRQWSAALSREEGEQKLLTLDSGAKERLELYLIAHPLVECVNNYLGDFLDKTLQEWAEASGAEG